MNALRNYQRKQNNPYSLPRTIYQRTIWAIRDYERLKTERNEIIYAASPQDSRRGIGGVSHPTEEKAIKLEEVNRQLQAIDRALIIIDDDMQQGLLDNICYQVPYPHCPSKATWGRTKAKFVHEVAKNLKYI